MDEYLNPPDGVVVDGVKPVSTFGLRNWNKSPEQMRAEGLLGPPAGAGRGAGTGTGPVNSTITDRSALFLDDESVFLVNNEDYFVVL